MKKRYTLFSLLFIPALLLLMAYTAGPPAGNTGSPLDGQDCSDCHTPGPAVQATNWITTNIPPEGWEPAMTYTITLTVNDQTAEKYGFQITAETADEKTGSWVITDAARTQLMGAGHVSHTTAGTSPVGNPNSWTVDWTAPASGTGTVEFYAAVNVTNNNGSNSGDNIYVTMLSVPESLFGIAENQLQTKLEVYPNPATSQLNMTQPVDSEIRIFDNSGREIMHRISSKKTETFDVSRLVNGMYFVHVSHNGQTASKSIIVH